MRTQNAFRTSFAKRSIVYFKRLATAAKSSNKRRPGVKLLIYHSG